MFSYAKYFCLYNLENQRELEELLAIISLFELENISFKCLITVENRSKFWRFINNEKIDFEIVKKTISKKDYSEIKFNFIGKQLESIIRIAAEEGETIYINSFDDTIELILNNNDHNFIKYNKKKYNTKEIKRSIKKIRKKFNISLKR